VPVRRLQATVTVQRKGGRCHRTGAQGILELVVGKLQAHRCCSLFGEQILDEGGGHEKALLAERDLAAVRVEERVVIARHDGADNEFHEGLRPADPAT